MPVLVLPNLHFYLQKKLKINLCSSGLGLERLRQVHSMRSAWEEVRKMRLRSPVSSKVQLHISNTLTISQRCKRSRLVI